MKILIDCPQPKKWWQIHRHAWSAQDRYSFGPGTAMSWRMRCGRCGRHKTVMVPG